LCIGLGKLIERPRPNTRAVEPNEERKKERKNERKKER
jgi:hypothetical protein